MIPVGTFMQQILLVRKNEKGEVSKQAVLDVVSSAITELEVCSADLEGGAGRVFEVLTRAFTIVEAGV